MDSPGIRCYFCAGYPEVRETIEELEKPYDLWKTAGSSAFPGSW